MHLPDRTAARGGVVVIVGVGAAFLLLHVVHAVGAGESLRTFLLWILIPAGFAAGIIAGGIGLRRLDIDPAYVPRVAAWCVVGAGVVAAMAVLTILYQQAEGVTVSDQLFVVVNAASGGGLVGLFVGVYDGRRRTAQAEADRLSQQLAVLNRVLRHDIRTSANVIQGNAELLADDATGPVEYARTIERQAADLVELGEHAREIERLLRERDADPKPVDLTPLVEACCERLRHDYPDADIDVSLPSTLPVVAHPLIESALSNIIENGLEHNETGIPRVSVDTTTVSHEGAEFVTLRVADNGPGIPEGERAVFERGYETDLEHASGLGLWLVNWIAVESGGTVRFEESNSGGTVVCLRLR